MTSKTPSRAELDLRATRKILNILGNEPVSTKRRIMAFVNSSLDQQEQDEKAAEFKAHMEELALPVSRELVTGLHDRQRIG